MRPGRNMRHYAANTPSPSCLICVHSASLCAWFSSGSAPAHQRILGRRNEPANNPLDSLLPAAIRGKRRVLKQRWTEECVPLADPALAAVELAPAAAAVSRGPAKSSFAFCLTTSPSAAILALIWLPSSKPAQVPPCYPLHARGWIPRPARDQRELKEAMECGWHYASAPSEC